MKTDNICERCKKPMDTTITEMNAIHYGQNFYDFSEYKRVTENR